MSQLYLQCYLCPNTIATRFYSISDFIDHLSSIHEKRYTSSYFCPLCSKNFSRRNAFTKHLKNTHTFPSRLDHNLVPDNISPPSVIEVSSPVNYEIPFPMHEDSTPATSVLSPPSSSSIEMCSPSNNIVQTAKDYFPATPLDGVLPPQTVNSNTTQTFSPQKTYQLHSQLPPSPAEGFDSLISSLLDKLESGALEFSLTLHAKPSVPRSTGGDPENC